jgi:hypothetical protein
VPLLRRQVLIGQLDLRGRKLAWHVEDAAVRQGWATIAGVPIGICAIVIGNLTFYGFPALNYVMAIWD